MKGKLKKIAALLLAAVMVFGATPLSGFVGLDLPNISDFFSVKAEAATYSASDAINYANSHWNDGVGLCAEFVSKCLNAGGISIPNKAYYSSSTQSYENNSGTLGAYTNPYTCSASLLLYLSSKYTVISNPSNSQISAGDIVFMYSMSNGELRWKDGHVGICIKNNGTAIYAAHNKATNTGAFSSNYPCTYVVKMGGHIHDYVAEGYEQLHPHKVFRKCSCGDWYYTGETKKLSTCLTCYPSILKVYYNANGGSISSDTYKLSSNVLYKKDDSTKYCQEWTYNNTKEHGLTNWETFGIYKKGYTFAGWGTKASGGTIFSDNDVSIKPSDLSADIKNGSCSITLYAQWRPNTLKVYYNANGASISSDTYKISSNVVCNKSDGSKFIQSWSYNNKKENGLTNYGTFGLYKQGYTFVGWGTKASGGTVYSQGDDSLVPTTLNPQIKDGDCSLTLYAQWVPNTLKVYYNVNGASITSDTYKVSSNLIYTKSDSVKFYQKWTYNNAKENGLCNASSFGIYKTGYHFAGWGTKASGGTAFDQNDATVTPLKLNSNIKNGSQSITLYAQWEPNTVRVYYNANGGLLSSNTYKLVSNNVCYSNDGTKIYHDWTYNNPVKNGFTNASTIGLYKIGYTFAGWSTKASGGTVFDQNDTSIVPTDFTSTIKNKNCSVTMYAQWIPNEVTMHFQSAGELLCQTHTVTNNGKLVTESAIERTSATQLKYNGKTYGVAGNKTAILTYGVDSNRISISDAGLTLDEHTGRGYIAYRDYDGTWRAFINGTVGWYTADEINKAISDGTFNGYNIYAQTGTLKTTSSKGNIYFYAVWVCNHTHNYTLTNTQKATCTEKEIKTYSCSCGDSYQTTQKNLGHDYVAIVTSPTCTSSGYTTHTCSRCLDSYVDTETEELGHSYVKTVVKEPTCVEEGKAEFKCSACNDMYSEDIECEPHEYIRLIVGATCTANGYTRTICNVCGESTIGEYVEPKSHNIQSEVIAPTCTEEGYTMNICSECTFSEKINIVPETGHSFGSWYEVEKATYREEGLMRRECIYCFKTEYKSIPKLDFSGICSECSKTFTDIDEYDAHMEYEDNKNFYKIQILSPSVTTISYGDSIILHTALENDLPFELIPNDWYIDWTVSNDNFSRTVSDDATAFTVSPNKSGDTMITVTLYDENGTVVSSDEQVMTSKAGFFDKLIGFFKKLFGLTKTIQR